MDAISKLVSVVFSHLLNKVLVEVLPRKSIDEVVKEAMELSEEEDSWMTPYILLLKKEYYQQTNKKSGKYEQVLQTTLCMRKLYIEKGTPSCC